MALHIPAFSPLSLRERELDLWRYAFMLLVPSPRGSLIAVLHKSAFSPLSLRERVRVRGFGLYYISTCVPSSITRLTGNLKNLKLPLAFFNIKPNNASRQRAMPTSLDAITVSRLRK